MSTIHNRCRQCGQPLVEGHTCPNTPSSAIGRFIVASPFSEGCTAYDLGSSLENDNPYDPDEPDYTEWRDGWYAGAECQGKY